MYSSGVRRHPIGTQLAGSVSRAGKYWLLVLRGELHAAKAVHTGRERADCLEENRLPALTGYMGVYPNSAREHLFQAKVVRNGKLVSLGCFKSVEAAALCYARSPEAAYKRMAASTVSAAAVREAPLAAGLVVLAEQPQLSEAAPAVVVNASLGRREQKRRREDELLVLYERVVAGWANARTSLAELQGVPLGTLDGILAHARKRRRGA